MIEIKPSSQQHLYCQSCFSATKVQEIFWQGMHTCMKGKCSRCCTTIIEPMQVGHSIYNPCQINFEKDTILCDTPAKGWLGRRLLDSLRNPQIEKVSLKVEVLNPSDKVIIVNCIDYLYGHCLLKMLNVQRHIQKHPEYGIVVITQKFLRWLVPKEVSEVWTVDIPLSKGDYYYPSLNDCVSNELSRFKEVLLSEVFSHPAKFDISQFTGLEKHNFEQTTFRITFIWREDRLWLRSGAFNLTKKLNLSKYALLLQNWKVRNLLYRIRRHIPQARFTVAGLGKETNFPDWIEDCRVDQFDEHKERAVCKVFF